MSTSFASAYRMARVEPASILELPGTKGSSDSNKTSTSQTSADWSANFVRSSMLFAASAPGDHERMGICGAWKINRDDLPHQTPMTWRDSVSGPKVELRIRIILLCTQALTAGQAHKGGKIDVISQAKLIALCTVSKLCTRKTAGTRSGQIVVSSCCSFPGQLLW